MREQLKACIVENFMFGASVDDIADQASLIDSGILDSTSVLELVLLLEQNFGIAIDGSELVPENLDSIARIEAFLERKGVAVVA